MGEVRWGGVGYVFNCLLNIFFFVSLMLDDFFFIGGACLLSEGTTDENLPYRAKSGAMYHTFSHFCFNCTLAF